MHAYYTYIHTYQAWYTCVAHGRRFYLPVFGICCDENTIRTYIHTYMHNHNLVPCYYLKYLEYVVMKHNTYIHTYIHTYIFVYVIDFKADSSEQQVLRVCMCMCVCVCALWHQCTYVCTCMCMYVYTYTCTKTYTNTYMHTHMHVFQFSKSTSYEAVGCGVGLTKLYSTQLHQGVCIYILTYIYIHTYT